MPQYGSLPFAQSIDFFKNKLNMPSDRWADVWKHQHNQSFMVAGAMKDDLLNDFRRAVDSAISQGKSLTWFKSEFNNIVAKHGWQHTGDASWRANVIYDTNMRQAYNAGRYSQLQQFEFWEYQHGDSRQPRPHHLAWHGTLLPKDHPWWETHFVSNGYGCKCKIRGRTAKQLERQGKTVKLPPKVEYKDWTDKVTGEVHKIPVGIDPGFDYAPKKSAVVKQTKQIAKKKAKPYEPPKRIVPTAFSSRPNATIDHMNAKLAELGTDNPRVQQLSQFLHKHDIKTLLVTSTEMNYRTKASRAIANDVKDYLKIDYYPHHAYTTRNASRTNGFTFTNGDHVVVKVTSKTRFAKANVNDLKKAVKSAIVFYEENDRQWSMSHIVRHLSKSGDNGGQLVTLIHELGHQVHFKAGMPKPPVPISSSLTSYGSKKDVEWYAEHFTAWLLDRDTLAQWDEGIARYFDDLMKKVL